MELGRTTNASRASPQRHRMYSGCFRPKFGAYRLLVKDGVWSGLIPGKHVISKALQ